MATSTTVHDSRIMTSSMGHRFDFAGSTSRVFRMPMIHSRLMGATGKGSTRKGESVTSGLPDG
jgi:hypothetical protein